MTFGPPRELIEHSIKVGSDLNLVQASGGNTSWKSADTIWVKGSGKRLKDADSQEIFAQIEYDKLSLSQIVSCPDFTPYKISATTPSIEANFHILIKKNFVTHLHSLAAIAIGALNLSSKDFSDFYKEHNISALQYSRPGVELANNISLVEGFEERILLLENHGVIFSDNEIEKLELKIKTFEQDVTHFISMIPSQDYFPGWIEILTEGVLTPDEAVFLGITPFVKSDESVENSISIKQDETLNFPRGTSQDRIDLAHFYVRVAKLIEHKAEIRYLAKEEVASLLNWDKEKLRIAMSK